MSSDDADNQDTNIDEMLSPDEPDLENEEVAEAGLDEAPEKLEDVTTNYSKRDGDEAIQNRVDTTIHDVGASRTAVSEVDLQADENKVAEAADPEGISKKRKAGRRLLGLVALLLGVVGMLATLAAAGLLIRTAVVAGDIADRAFEPVDAALGRLETRIDETDDLVDPSGVDSSDLKELRARSDGLVDIASTSNQAFQAIDDHVIYGLLPADLSSLRSTLSDFQQSSGRIDRAVDGAPQAGLGSSAASAAATEIDAMQAKVTGSREQSRSANDSLTSWLRIGSGIGILLSLLCLWGQYSLLRRGWRGLKGRAAH